MSFDQSKAAQELAEMFPDVDHGHLPLGTRVVVQLKMTPKKKGLIELIQDTRDSEQWNNQVAKVCELGALAYRNRATREQWPEGTWANRGDYVRVPRWGGDRWDVPHPTEHGEKVTFVTFNDVEIISIVKGDPAQVRAFIL